MLQALPAKGAERARISKRVKDLTANNDALRGDDRIALAVALYGPKFSECLGADSRAWDAGIVEGTEESVIEGFRIWYQTMPPLYKRAVEEGVGARREAGECLTTQSVDSSPIDSPPSRFSSTNDIRDGRRSPPMLEWSRAGSSDAAGMATRNLGARRGNNDGSSLALRGEQDSQC